MEVDLQWDAWKGCKDMTYYLLWWKGNAVSYKLQYPLPVTGDFIMQSNFSILYDNDWCYYACHFRFKIFVWTNGAAKNLFISQVLCYCAEVLTFHNLTLHIHKNLKYTHTHIELHMVSPNKFTTGHFKREAKKRSDPGGQHQSGWTCVGW